MNPYGQKEPTTKNSEFERKAKRSVVLLLCLLIISSANTLCSAQINIKKYEDRKNTKKLILILQDEEISKSDRSQAAWALGRLQDNLALEPLLEALNDDDLRKASVWALGDIGGEKATDALVSVLTDESSPEKEEAAKALNRLGWKPATDMENAYYLVAMREWDKCRDLGDIVIEPLVFTLKNGNDNAKLGAKVSLDSLGWIPEKDNMEAYSAAKEMEAEIIAFRELIIMEEVKLKHEFAINFQKLKEDQKAGHIKLSEEEFSSLEKRFTQDIIQEQDEIDAFRAYIYKVQLKITRFGDDIYLGKENPKGKGVMVFQIVRDPHLSQLRSIWRNKWTGKPTKEFEWDPKTPDSGNFYRYNSKGEKYLFARYFFKDPRRRQIDIMERDGSIRERIFLGPESTVSTRIHEDNWDIWVEWPQEINWASERLKFLEADLITSGGSLFGK